MQKENMQLKPRYFVEWWGDLQKDPLDKGVASFDHINGPNSASTFAADILKNKNYTIRMFEGYDMYYRGSGCWPIK